MTEAQLNQFFSATRAVLIAFGTWLSMNGYGNSTLYARVEMGAGLILIVGPTVWGVVAAASTLIKGHLAGVNAALKLVASGQAIDVNGNLLPPTPSTTPPMPATSRTAQEIVAKFSSSDGK